MIKRMAKLLLTVTLISSLAAAPCSAAESAFQEAFSNAFYGGLLGGLAGTALLVFANKPADHVNYIYYGAAGGVLVGAAFGLAKSSKSLVSIENGNVKVAMPTIKPELQRTDAKGPVGLLVKADLLSASF